MSPSVALDSREFLTSCLKVALEDPDLVDAISDQALELGLSALTIGRGQVTVDQLKDRLYLTMDEAKSVLNICSSRIAGTKPTLQETQGPLSLRLLATPSGRLALNLSVKDRQLVAPSATEVTDGPDENPSFEALDVIMENAAVVVVSRASGHAAEKKFLVSNDTVAELGQLIRPASDTPLTAHAAVRESPAVVAMPAKSSIPKPIELVLPPKPSTPKPTEPVLPQQPPAPKPSELTLPPPEPSAASPRISSPTMASSPASAPSYLRPTAAHKARISKDVDSAASLSLAPVPEDQQQRRRRSLFSRMASTLLAPTQAFVARVTGRSDEVKSKKDMPVSKASVQLEAVLCSPQGQRVTKPQPFTLRSEMRLKSSVVSTEELDLAEARDKAFKRNPVPKHVHETRPIVPTQRTAPKDPHAVFEPFQLASVELHKKKIEQMRKKAEDDAAREEETRRFKARTYDARIAASPITPPKPPASPATRGSAPVFASEARIAHYHEVIEPAKKAKEAENNKDKLEADRKAKELEDMNVDDFRKTLEFKARPMPDFSSPFRLDPSLARPVTSPAEPQLHTVKRLGAAPMPGGRSNKDGPGLGNGVYDGSGYVDAFSASLRKSTSIPMGRGGAASAGKSGAPLGRSAAVRQSASGAFGRSNGAGGGNSLRGSVGSSLQAAIRAAARDAARDLAASGCNMTDVAAAN